MSETCQRFDAHRPDRASQIKGAKMPARTARCLFLNQTNLDMTLVFTEDLVHGDYTGLSCCSRGTFATVRLGASGCNSRRAAGNA